MSSISATNGSLSPRSRVASPSPPSPAGSSPFSYQPSPEPQFRTPGEIPDGFSVPLKDLEEEPGFIHAPRPPSLALHTIMTRLSRGVDDNNQVEDLRFRLKNVYGRQGSSCSIPVIVKRIRSMSTGLRLDPKRLNEELLLLVEQHSKLSHLYLMGILGLVELPDVDVPRSSSRVFGLVYPAYEESLYDFVRVNKMNAHDRLQMLHKVAGAVTYLHLRKIVHGDIRLANIRMIAGHIPMLMGGGITLAMGRAKVDATGNWPDPHTVVHPYASLTEPSFDVYAFATVVMAILTEKPLQEKWGLRWVDESRPIYDISDIPLRPDGKEHMMSDVLWEQLLQWAWNPDPRQRMSMSNLEEVLKDEMYDLTLRPVVITRHKEKVRSRSYWVVPVLAVVILLYGLRHKVQSIPASPLDSFDTD